MLPRQARQVASRSPEAFVAGRVARCTGALRSACAMLALLMGMAGCVTRGGLLLKEHCDVGVDQHALVLLRVTCHIDDRFEECFGDFSWSSDGPLVAFGLGRFETVGEPHPAWGRHLSEASLRAGWVSFLLPAGVYYLSVMGPTSGAVHKSSIAKLREVPRWRFDVPDNASRLYVGTLNLAGEVTGKLAFGAKIIAPAASAPNVTLTNESELAASLFTDCPSGQREVVTHPMTRWRPGDSIIIRTPKAPGKR